MVEFVEFNVKFIIKFANFYKVIVVGFKLLNRSRVDYSGYTIKLGKFIYKSIYTGTIYKGFIRGKRLGVLLVKGSLLLVKANFLIKILIFRCNKMCFIYILKLL